MHIHTERMGPHFLKLHMQIGKFPVRLHHFTEPDQVDPHSHPLPFTTTILMGGYIDEFWFLSNGRWNYKLIERKPGTSHRVNATDVHRIVRLPQGECLTSVVWHDDVERIPWRFWRFDDHQVRSRLPEEPEFR